LGNWKKAQQAEGLKKSDLWTNMNSVREYKVLNDYRIWVRFEDGFEGTVHLKPLLIKGITVELLEATTFSNVTIESGGGLAWENGFDICPNSLRELVEQKVHVA